MRGKTFTSGSIAKAMLAFVGPYLLGILVQNLYGAVDLFVVGHYASTADVSAVTIGSQLMTIATQLVIGLATGITILTGQYFGAKDEKGLNRTVSASVLLFGISAIVLTGVYLIFYPMMVSVMQTPAEAVSQTREYLLYCSLGIVFIIGYNIISSILTGLGNSRTPFLFIVVACIINVVLDVILVRYAGLGARGAAIATTAAQAGSFLFSLIYISRKGLGFARKKTAFGEYQKQFGLIFTIGGPVAVQNVLVGFSFLFITAIINQMGVVASAAVGVVEKLITFLFVPATAMGTAVSTAASQNIGAGQMDRAKKAMWIGIGMALVPAVAITLYCQFYGASLTGILNRDPQVVSLAADYLRSYILDVIMVSFVFCMNGFFNSCGKSWFSLVHSLVTTFVGRIPLAFFFSRLEHTSLFAIGWAAPVSTFISLLLCLVFLSYLNRKSPKGRKTPG